MTPAPISLVLHLTSACNARCRNCRWHRMRAEGKLPRQHLAPASVAAMLDRLRPSAVSLTGTGEPLMHPEFDEIVDVVERHHREVQPFSEVTLVTNGSLLARRAGVARLLTMPGHVEVSLDAANAALHETLRPGTGYAEVVANLRAFVVAPRSVHRAVGVIANISERNVDQVFAIARLAHGLWADFCMITRTIQLDLAEATVDEELPPTDPRVRAQIAEAVHVFGPSFVRDFFTPTGAGAQSAVKHCEAPWTTFQVFPDEHVHLCCRAYDVDLGHWSDSSIWNGPVLTRLRQQLEARVVDPIEFASCARCPLK